MAARAAAAGLCIAAALTPTAAVDTADGFQIHPACPIPGLDDVFIAVPDGAIGASIVGYDDVACTSACEGYLPCAVVRDRVWEAGKLEGVAPSSEYALCVKSAATGAWERVDGSLKTCGVPSFYTDPGGCWTRRGGVIIHVDASRTPAFNVTPNDTLAVVFPNATGTTCERVALQQCTALNGCSRRGDTGVGGVNGTTTLSWLPGEGMKLAGGVTYRICMQSYGTSSEGTWFMLDGVLKACDIPSMTVAPVCPVPGELGAVAVTLRHHPGRLTADDEVAIVPANTTDCTADAISVCEELGTCSYKDGVSLDKHGRLVWTLPSLPDTFDPGASYSACYRNATSGTWSLLDDPFVTCAPLAYDIHGICPFFTGVFTMSVTGSDLSGAGTEVSVNDSLAIVPADVDDCASYAMSACTVLEACSYAVDIHVWENTLTWTPDVPTAMNGTADYGVCYWQAARQTWTLLPGVFTTCELVRPPSWFVLPACPSPGYDRIVLWLTPAGMEALTTDDEIAIVPYEDDQCGNASLARCGALDSCSDPHEVTRQGAGGLRWDAGTLPLLELEQNYHICYRPAGTGDRWLQLSGHLPTCFPPVFAASPPCPTAGEDNITIVIKRGTEELSINDTIALVPSSLRACGAGYARTACKKLGTCSSVADLSLSADGSALTWEPGTLPLLSPGESYTVCFNNARHNAWARLEGDPLVACAPVRMDARSECLDVRRNAVAIHIHAGSLPLNAGDTLALVPAGVSRGCEGALAGCAASGVCSTPADVHMFDTEELEWAPGVLRGQLQDAAEYAVCYHHVAKDRWEAAVTGSLTTCEPPAPPTFAVSPAFCPSEAVSVTVAPGGFVLSPDDLIAVVPPGTPCTMAARRACTRLASCSAPQHQRMDLDGTLHWAPPDLAALGAGVYRVCYHHTGYNEWMALDGDFRACTNRPDASPKLISAPECVEPLVGAMDLVIKAGSLLLQVEDRMALVPESASCDRATVTAACARHACSAQKEEVAAADGSRMSWHHSRLRVTPSARFKVCYEHASLVGLWVEVEGELRTCTVRDRTREVFGLTNSTKAALERIGAANAALGAVGGAGAGVQALLRGISCDVDDVDFQYDRQLDPEFHPTRVAITDTPSRYLMGAVAMNMLSWVLFAIACNICAGLYCLVRRVSPSDGRARVQVPGVLMIPYMFLLPGTMLASCRLLFVPNDVAWAPVGAAGLVWCATCSAIHYWWVIRHVPTAASYRTDPRLLPPGAEALTPSGQPIGIYVGWARVAYKALFGPCIWVNTAMTKLEGDPFFCERYGLAFDNLREGHTNFYLFEQGSVVLISALSVWKPTELGACHVRNVSICVVLGGFFLLIAIWRPYNAIIDNVCALLIAGLTITAVLCITLSIELHTGSGHTLVEIAGWCLILCAWLLILKVICEILRYGFDMFIGRRAKARKLARELAGYQVQPTEAERELESLGKTVSGVDDLASPSVHPWSLERVGSAQDVKAVADGDGEFLAPLLVSSRSVSVRTPRCASPAVGVARTVTNTLGPLDGTHDAPPGAHAHAGGVGGGGGGGGLDMTLTPRLAPSLPGISPRATPLARLTPCATPTCGSPSAFGRQHRPPAVNLHGQRTGLVGRRPSYDPSQGLTLLGPGSGAGGAAAPPRARSPQPTTR